MYILACQWNVDKTNNERILGHFIKPLNVEAPENIIKEVNLVLRFSINYFIFFAALATLVPEMQILRVQEFRAYEIGLLLGIFEITGIFWSPAYWMVC